MIHLGEFAASHTAVCIPFDSFAASTGAPSAVTNFAAADVQIYKDGSNVQRSSASGITVTTSFDSQTGLQMIVIDLSDNADAGFYAAGHEYQVAIADVTIDGQTVRFWAATFAIERANGVLARLKAGTVKVDVDTIKTQALTAAAGITFPSSIASPTNITAATGVVLSAAGVQAIWDALTSALTTVGSIGKLLVTDLDATVSSRMATFTLPSNFSTLVIDSTGRVNAFLIGILTSVFTEGATGRIAAAFKQFFNISTPAATMDHLVLVDTATTATTATNLTNAATAGDFTSAMKTSLNAATPAVTVSDKTGFSLSAAGVQAIWDALSSALTTVGSIGKRLVDNLNATITSRAVAGDAMTLTSGERTAVANEVESQIIDESDSEKVLTAITDKIASVNPSLGGLTLAAIASQVRTELTTELARIDVAISTRLATAGYTSPLDAAAVRAAIGLASANLDTQLDALPTAAEIGTQITSDHGAGSYIRNTEPLTAASTRAAVGLASANLDTQLTPLTHLDADVSSRATPAQVKTQADAAISDAEPIEANVKQVNDVDLIGDGAATPWGPA